MGLFDWFSKQKTAKPPNPKGHEFSDDERDLSLRTRKIKADEKKLEYLERKLESELRQADIKLSIEQKKQELANLTAPDEDDYEDESQGVDFEDMIGQLFMKKLQESQKTPTPKTPAAPIPQTAVVDLTELQINNMLDSNPEIVRRMHKLPDPMIKDLIKQRFPMLSDNTLSIAVGCIKKKVIING